MLTLSPKVEREVLLLPSDERLALIDKLIISLNLPTQADVDELWAKEAEKSKAAATTTAVPKK